MEICQGKKDYSNFQTHRSAYRLIHYQIRQELWLLLCGIRHYIFFMTNTSFEGTSNTKVNSEIIIASVRPEPRKETFEEPVRISWNSTELVIKVTIIFALRLLIGFRVGFHSIQLKKSPMGGGAPFRQRR